MPEKEIYHEQVQVHPFHHPAHPGVTAGPYPLQFPSAFVAFHTPLSAAVEQRAHDAAAAAAAAAAAGSAAGAGRYLWDPSGAPPPPHPSSFHHSAHG